MIKTGWIVMILVGLGGLVAQVHAAPIVFVGEDLQPNPGPTVRTNSDAAAASFRAAASAVGPVGTITFESAPVGAFTNLTVAPGVTINGADNSGAPLAILNATGFPSAPSLAGSNTTPGGTNFVAVNGGSLTFTFAAPTQFFGAYLTGVQTNFFHDSITFNDGTTQTIALVGAGTSGTMGEIAFLGFIDTGKSITSITINAGTLAINGGDDAIGVDDASYQAQAVPEPSSLTLCAIAAAPALWYVWMRRRTRA